MVNDSPFVPLPSPPRDPTQSDAEADVHGYDRDDEHAKALAYKQHVADIATKQREHLAILNGNTDARRNLHRKWIGVLPNTPPYLEGG